MENPTLADVLYAIEIKERKINDGEIDYSAFGEIFLIGKYEKVNRNGYYSKCYWNLLQDLNHQKPEVWDFLLTILEEK